MVCLLTLGWVPILGGTFRSRLPLPTETLAWVLQLRISGKDSPCLFFFKIELGLQKKKYMFVVLVTYMYACTQIIFHMQR